MTLPDTRVTLLNRLRDGRDTAAWSEFCSIYEKAIYRVALRFGLQDADAREVSQDVLLAVSRKISEFDLSSNGSFRGWLSKVARNATLDLLRKNQRRKVSTGDSALQRNLGQMDIAADEPSIFDFEAQREQFLWAAEKIRGKVTESTWKAFWRTSMDGLSSEETAKELGLTVGAVYVARCRTLAKIKHLINTFKEPS